MSWNLELYDWHAGLSCSSFSLIVQVLTGNTSVMHYTNRQAAETAPLCQEPIHLWDLCICYQIILMALPLPGLQNTLVDQLSSDLTETPWMVPQDPFFHSVFCKGGFPQVDLFVTCHSKCQSSNRRLFHSVDSSSDECLSSDT